MKVYGITILVALFSRHQGHIGDRCCLAIAGKPLPYAAILGAT